MRGDDFRSGQVGIHYINGFEGAADFVRKYVRDIGPEVTNPPDSPWTVPVDHEFIGNGPTCTRCTRPPSLHAPTSPPG